jgi:hypothetical protein
VHIDLCGPMRTSIGEVGIISQYLLMVLKEGMGVISPSTRQMFQTFQKLKVMV